MSITARQPLARRKLAKLLSTAIKTVAGTTGSMFFVSSVIGSSNYSGTEIDQCKATITQAVALVTANKGDVVVCHEDHAETVSSAGGITLSKAGMVLLGIGSHDKRPTLSSSATDSTIIITGASVKVVNMRFLSTVDSLVTMVDCQADGAVFEDCSFLSTAGADVLNFVNLTTTKDNFAFRRCRFHQPADPAGTNGNAGTGAIYCVDTERVIVEDCEFTGYFETAVLHNKTTAMKYLTWRRNTVQQQLTDAVRILTPVGTVGNSYGPDNDYIPGLGYPVQRAAAVVPATTTTNYFSVVGGPVLVGQFTGVCTTVFSATLTNLKFSSSNTASGAATDVCANLAVANLAAGVLFGIAGPFATALSGTNAVVGASQGFVAAAGSITCTTSATNTGAAKWSLFWSPAETSLGIPNVYAA